MRIVMTGATAGFGLYAAERLLASGATLAVGARNPAALPPTLQGRVAALPLDLDALANVRAFAAALGEGPIDVLVLNAGLQLAKAATSADGFERTFAVNLLAHYLVLGLLAPRRLPGIDVLAFDPGYVPHTGLGRDNGRVIATLVSYILPLLMKRDRSSTIPRSGQYLADLAIDPRYTGAHGDYWSVRSPALVRIEPSTLARDEAACARLWDDPARLVGL